MSSGLTGYNGYIREASRGGSWPRAVILEDGGAAAPAAAFAAAAGILCRTGERDCRCRDCRKAAEGIHPDVTVIDRGGAAVSVGDIREMRRAALVAPLEAQRRVFILRGAENMTAAAQNAALKVFEEPPDGVYFILQCAQADALLPTVRSRCVTLRRAGWETADNRADDRAAQPDDAADDRAREFLAAFAAGGELRLFEASLKFEKAKRQELDLLFTAVLNYLRTALRGALDAPAPQLPPQLEGLYGVGAAGLMRMAGIISVRRELARAAVGAAHLAGTIAPEYYRDPL